MATVLASSCLTCRKRQVKCDGTKPTCKRCPKDGRECRGYKGQLRIVQFHPAKKARQDVYGKPRAAPQPLATVDLVLPKHIFANDRDIWTIMQCTEYWNKHIIPETYPIERPFYRVLIQGNEIVSRPLPKVCLHFIILAFRSTQAAKLLIDPSTQSDLCYYRGLGLRELAGHLDGAATDPFGVALVSIVMLLTSELVLPESSWLIHLDAARRVVALRGGIAACMSMSSDTVFILTQYFIIDTLTSTTCASTSLPQSTYDEMVGDLPDIDFQLITCVSACPADILKAIARTSSLRRQRLDSIARPSPEYDTLLASLENFDCSAWAVRLSHMGLTYPVTAAIAAPCSSIKGLVSIAECFRSATLIYLLLSCGAPGEREVMDRVQCATATLHTELDALFRNASDNSDGPLDSQLWKFATWPLFIAAYVWVSFDLTSDTGDLIVLSQCLHKISESKGTLLRSTAERHLKEVQAQRTARPNASWTWDMGFTDRKAFVL